VKGKKHEFSLPAVEEFLETPLLGKIPEDAEVSKALSRKLPVVNHSPDSRHRST